MKSPKDPVDHARTTRPHAGETMKDSRNMPAVILLGVSGVSFVGGLAAYGTDNYDVGAILMVISTVLLVISLAWFLIAHLRVRKIEDRWHEDHPDAERQRPTS
ncbi:protein UsfY [Mycobacterium sp. IDR2000157661]|uniref:protein UsfY n=1 Tax=Mycobacterium sp. IDR2000157661 TaxID=2867005 RepID=UPI001EECA09C|nr:protein UsfY [Mycobacterium sp. IDR2000157661]ULE33657.1 UsfY protein [Mycobacterium sp. IDR2000157661]